MAASSDRDKDPKGTQPQQDNPFIRFRQFADAQIGSLLQGITGLPSAFSKNPSGNARWADFDEDLRRRDELQARQREIREQEDQKHGGGKVELPAQKLPESADGLSQDANRASNYIPYSEAAGRDIALYSPVSKRLFSHLSHSNASEEWGHSTDQPLQGSFRMEYFPFRLRLDQHPSNAFEAVQYLAYNQLEASPTLRSDYSLLPYILFSPYSPMKLEMEASKHNETVFSNSRRRGPTQQPIVDNLPYSAAFEDLMKTSQNSMGNYYNPGFRLLPLINSLFSTNGSQHGVPWMAWINQLHWDNILQQREIRELPRFADMVPASAFVTGKAGTGEEKDSGEAQSELDMYDRFLSWASSPNTVAGALEALDSVCSDTEGFIEKQLKALESLDDKRPFSIFKDSIFSDVSSARNMKDTDELQEMSCKRRSRSSVGQEASAQSNASAKPYDGSKVLSTSTTTEHTTHEDGSVETCVTVWKRFADGRESVTTTTHCEDATSREPEDLIAPAEADDPDPAPKNNEKLRGEKKGWFWN